MRDDMGGCLTDYEMIRHLRSELIDVKTALIQAIKIARLFVPSGNKNHVKLDGLERLVKFKR